MAPPDLVKELAGRVDSSLSPRRAAHSRGVADLAEQLCGLHGLDPRAGRVAGLAHDLCKELPQGEQQLLFDAWLEEDALAPLWVDAHGSGYFSEQVLHGPAAAIVLRREYGVMDEAVLESVAWHTVGRAGMSTLAVLVYCADKMEPGRKHVDASFRERCLSLEPADMFLAIVEDSIGYLARKGWAIAPATMSLYNSLRNPEART